MDQRNGIRAGTEIRIVASWQAGNIGGQDVLPMNAKEGNQIPYRVLKLIQGRLAHSPIRSGQSALNLRRQTTKQVASVAFRRIGK